MRAIKARFPVIFLVLLTVFPVFLVNIFTGGLHDHYLLSLTLGAFALEGVILGWLWQYRFWTRVIALSVAAVFIFTQLWAITALYQWTRSEGWSYGLRMPMATYRSLIKDWSQTGDVLVIIASGEEEGLLTNLHQGYTWAIMGDGYPLRSLNMIVDQGGIPIASTGTRLVSLSNSDVLDQFGTRVDLVGSSVFGLDPVFKTVVVTPSDFMADIMFKPTELSRFSNQASILGVYASNQPQSSQVWVGNLMWQVNALADEEYQFSIRVMDENDNVYGQSDFRSLDSYLWRVGDTVVNQFQMSIAVDLDRDASLRIQVIMYKFSDGRHIDVIDDRGNTVSPWLFLE